MTNTFLAGSDDLSPLPHNSALPPSTITCADNRSSGFNETLSRQVPDIVDRVGGNRSGGENARDLLFKIRWLRLSLIILN